MSEEPDTNGVVDRVRPLTATAARSLTALVEIDFEMLRQEMKEFQAEQVDAKVNEMRAGADPEARELLRQQADDLIENYRKESRTLIDDARRSGITVVLPGIGGRFGDQQVVEVRDDDLEKRVTAYRAQALKEFTPLLHQLDRMELDAKRRVLLASITSEAEEILKNIPKAKDMFVKAQEEKTKGIEASDE